MTLSQICLTMILLLSGERAGVSENKMCKLVLPLPGERAGVRGN